MRSCASPRSATAARARPARRQAAAWRSSRPPIRARRPRRAASRRSGPSPTSRTCSGWPRRGTTPSDGDPVRVPGRAAPALGRRALAARDRRATRVDALFENSDPDGFDELLRGASGLDAGRCRALSPGTRAARVRRPGRRRFRPSDSVLPASEARALERAGAQVTMTPALGHVRPRPSARPRAARPLRRPDARSCDPPSRHERATAPLPRGGDLRLCRRTSPRSPVLYGGGRPIRGRGRARVPRLERVHVPRQPLLHVRSRPRGFWGAYLRYVLVGILVAALNAAVLAALVEGAGARASARLWPCRCCS